jgi:protease II
VILDICEVPFIPPKLLRQTVIEGFKISDDHSLIAFKVDIGNMERVTAGFKDMTTGKVLKTKLTNVGDIIFGCGRTVFYTECDADSNRPYKVVRYDVRTGESQTIFMDDNPTHYVDIGITKDKKYIVINSNTKEDSEVWVTERTESLQETLPRKLITRVKDV